MAQLLNTNLFSDANLVAYWRLEDVNDSKGSNNLTNINTVTFPAAVFGNGANLVAASSQCLNIADNAALSITGAISIGGWFKFATTPSSGNDYQLVAKWDNEGTGLISRSYDLILRNTAGTLKLDFVTSSNGGNSGVVEKTWNWTPTTGVWYHIFVTQDTSGNVIAYINGVSQGTLTGANTSISDQAQKLWIGAVGNGSGGQSSFDDGMIDDLAIFSRVLTPAEVLTLFNPATGMFLMF